MDLRGKTTVITGATKGLGRALALKFKEAGARVVVSARDTPLLPETGRELKCDYYPADVAHEDQVEKLAAYVVKRLGSVDIWINNAGIWLPVMQAGRVPGERIRKLVEVDLLGTIYGSRAALSKMVSQKEGTIVNIISTSALQGRAGQAIYCAAKFGADGFSKAIREEVRGEGIRVISVFPGGMQTNFFDELMPEEYNEYMSPTLVAAKIVDNIRQPEPQEEQILRRK